MPSLAAAGPTAALLLFFDWILPAFASRTERRPTPFLTGFLVYLSLLLEVPPSVTGPDESLRVSATTVAARLAQKREGAQMVGDFAPGVGSELSQLSTGLLLPDAVHRIFQEGQVLVA